MILYTAGSLSGDKDTPTQNTLTKGPYTIKEFTPKSKSQYNWRGGVKYHKSREKVKGMSFLYHKIIQLLFHSTYSWY